MAATVLRSMLRQGILSSYRRQYWKFLSEVLTRWSRNRAKLRMGIVLLFSGHHFINYAKSVTDELDAELQKLTATETSDGFEPYSQPVTDALVPIG
jgi:hypothetical protein